MIVIHIGLKKTGSTSIQKFLSVNQETLRTMGVDYTRIGQGKRGNHINLFYEISGHHNFNPKYGTLADAIDCQEKNESKTMVFSSEDFESFSPENVALFHSTLTRLEDQVQIVMVIRDLITMIASEYSQKIRNGLDTVNFDTFFERRRERRAIPFVDTADSWANSFGWENLRVRILDPRHLKNGDLADDFLAIFGLDPLGVDARRLERPGVVNASPGWRVQEAVRALYDGGHRLPEGHALAMLQNDNETQRKAVGRFSRKLGEKRGWNSDRGQYLTRDQAQRCLDAHTTAVAALNEKLSEKLPQPLDLETRGFVERKFMPDASHIPDAELREFYDDLALMVTRRDKSR
jgi:hypothetical protein